MAKLKGRRWWLRTIPLCVIVAIVIGFWIWWKLPEADVEVIWSIKEIIKEVHSDKSSNLLVVVKTDNTLARLDYETGRILWSVPFPECGNMYSFAAQGSVILFSGKGAVCRFDPSTGSLLWKTDLWDEKSFGKIMIGALGDSLLAHHEETLYSLAQADGKLRWKRNVGNVDIHPLSNHVMAVSWKGSDSGGFVIALHTSDGSIAWEYPRPLNHSRIVTISDSEVLVHVDPSTAVILDKETGKEKWLISNFRLAYDVKSDLLGYLEPSGDYALIDMRIRKRPDTLLPKGTIGLIEATPNRLYLEVWDGHVQSKLFCIERRTGKVLWKAKVPLMRVSLGLDSSESIPVAHPDGIEERNGWVLARVFAVTGCSMGSFANHYREDAYSEKGDLLWTAPLPGRPIRFNPPHVLCLDARNRGILLVRCDRLADK